MASYFLHPIFQKKFMYGTFYKQILLHTDAFTHRRFLPTNAFAHLHTNTFAQRRLYTQHRGFYTQRLLHTDNFIHRSFYAQRLLHTKNSHEIGVTGNTKSQFYLNFWRSNFISCERIAPDKLKSQFYLNFWRSNLISCERFGFRAVSLALPLLPPSKEK